MSNAAASVRRCRGNASAAPICRIKRRTASRPRRYDDRKEPRAPRPRRPRAPSRMLRATRCRRLHGLGHRRTAVRAAAHGALEMGPASRAVPVRCHMSAWRGSVARVITSSSRRATCAGIRQRACIRFRGRHPSGSGIAVSDRCARPPRSILFSSTCRSIEPAPRLCLPLAVPFLTSLRSRQQRSLPSSTRLCRTPSAPPRTDVADYYAFHRSVASIWLEGGGTGCPGVGRHP